MFGWGWHFSTDATSPRPINSSARQFERAETETQTSVWEEQGPQEAGARENSNYKLRPLLTWGALASHHHWAKRRRIQYFSNNKRNQFHMSVPNFFAIPNRLSTSARSPTLLGNCPPSYRLGPVLSLVLPWSSVILHPLPPICTYYRFMYVRQ